MKLFLIDISWLFLFSKFGYPVSVENTKKIFLKPPDSPVEYGIYFKFNYLLKEIYLSKCEKSKSL